MHLICVQRTREQSAPVRHNCAGLGPLGHSEASVDRRGVFVGYDGMMAGPHVAGVNAGRHRLNALPVPRQAQASDIRAQRAMPVLVAECKFSVNLRHLFSPGMRHGLGHCLRDGDFRARRGGGCFQLWREARSSS
jgi:hypothetical protein